jgi:antitoxin (DNA-binding transcriptional repressor) of toxin-antitoxin stability system
MRQVSLREFRTRGAKVLKAVPKGETVLLAGQQGPAYFLIPVFGDVVTQDLELRRAMAKASLRKGWLLAKASGAEPMGDEELDREIAEVRDTRRGVPGAAGDSRAAGARKKRKSR